MNPESRKRLETLTSLYLDDGLDLEQKAELESLLANDEEAASVHIQLLTVHSDLGLLTPSECTKPPAGNACDADSNAKIQARVTRTPASNSWVRYAIVGAAASLLTFAVLYNLRPSSSGIDSQLASSSSKEKAGQKDVARIIRKVDCDWEGDRWGVVSSASFEPGQTLSMARGLMELEFGSGARVTLEGPASFTVDTAMSGTLSYGKLTAEVPEQAHGFTIMTPGGETIDLGTKFGLLVKRNGATETHVFEGEVIVQPQGTGEDEQVRLTTDMAIRQGVDPTKMSSLDSIRSRFISLDLENKSTQVPPVDRKLALWFAADQQIQIDENGRVSAWGDLSTVGNDKSQNAWQVVPTQRPMWVEKSTGGLPAVRFTGNSIMVTEPVGFGSSHSVAVVFRIDAEAIEKQGLTKAGRQILNMNGPPHLTLRVDARGRLLSQAYPGYSRNDELKKTGIMVGVTSTRQKLTDAPVVALSIYDPNEKQTRLYLNGVLQQRTIAPDLGSTHSPRHIGGPYMHAPKSYFLGDISELMAFDAGLTDEEAEKVSLELMKKYGIEKQ